MTVSSANILGAPGRALRSIRFGFRDWRRRNRLNFLMACLILAFLLLVLWPRMFINIPAGSVGVLWLRLGGGTQFGFHYNPGLKVIAPWDMLFVYDVRLHRVDEKVRALTRDGLSVDVELTLSYFVNRDMAPNLHETLGPQYETTLIRPTVSSEIRNAVAELRPDDLYGISRTALEQRVATLVRNVLARSQLDVGGDHQMLDIQDIFIRNITLPPLVQTSIEQKIAEEQNALRFQFVLEKERLESERKAIEAQGIRQFQDIVSSGISDRYLRWKGIDATLQLARSPNSKVVVIGAQNGLPLILDTTDRHGADGDREGGGASPLAVTRQPPKENAQDPVSATEPPPRTGGPRPGAATQTIPPANQTPATFPMADPMDGNAAIGRPPIGAPVPAVPATGTAPVTDLPKAKPSP